MRFLRLLLWLMLIVGGLILAWRNWRDVSLSLWGDLILDIRLPLLLLIMFLMGLVPTWAIMAGRLWRAQRALALANHARYEPAVTAAATEPQP